MAAMATLTLGAGLGTAAHAQAQAGGADAPQVITVTGRTNAQAASVAGFGDIPLAQSPFAASVISRSQLADAGIASLGDITRLDAATTDAYNAPGYWGMLAVRGFTLDNRFNYRRDGLPINAETALPQANKQSLELLKGISGIQAGTSAPGGLVNLIVKRPKGMVNEASLAWSADNTQVLGLDIGRADHGFGWRLNAEVAQLQPAIDDSKGHRRLLALAVEAQPGTGTWIEAEIESSRQSQPSTPGFSLLGDRLPSADAIDPRTNLNRQPWRLPVVMDGLTGSLRVTQQLSGDLRLVAHAMRQRLGTDDRIAFPFGCSAEERWDRYCSNGSFDLYDYRSEGERRTSDAFDLSVAGQGRIGGMTHGFNAGVLFTRYQARFHDQAYNWVGTGTIDGATITPADPSLQYPNTDRLERSTEVHLQDAIQVNRFASLWLGLRHTQIDRRSVGTDGSAATGYRQSFSTPWLAFTHALPGTALAYASWGKGVESEVAPNLPRYRNANQALPALQSRQFELGIKQHGATLNWAMAMFDIRRPAWTDQGPCDDTARSCLHAPDGWARHRGLEAEAEWRAGPWSLRGSAMWLHATREGASDAGTNRLRPTNVPATSVKLQGAYNVAAMPGLALLAFVTHEGQRMVLPDNSVATPGWTRLDLAARYTVRQGDRTLTWRAGIDNLMDERAWKEAPYQYGHAYLYPLAPRGVHLSAQVAW